LRGSPCPVYLLCGTHDLSATPGHRMRAGRIGAAHIRVTRAVGRLPMSGCPAVFRDDLPPVPGFSAGDGG